MDANSINFLGLTRPINPSTSGIGSNIKVGSIDKTSGIYEACEALSIKDGTSPDITGSCCGQFLDIGKNGSIDNQAWGI